MPTPLPTVNLAAATIGTKGTIDLTTVAPTSNPAWTNKPATLQAYNESSFGLELDFRNTGGGLNLPSGGWQNIQIDAGESLVDYTVLYIIPNAANNLLLLTYYAPNEDVPEIAALGNSPINIGNQVPVGSAAAAIVNDGNASGTQIIESTPSGAGQSWLALNDGTLTISPLSNGSTAPALKVIPGAGAGVFSKVQFDNNAANTNGQGGISATQFQAFVNTTVSDVLILGYTDTKVGGKSWQFTAKINGNFELQDTADGHIIWIGKTDGSILLANQLVTCDASGNVIATSFILAAGNQESGQAGARFSNCTGGDTVAVWVNFKTVMTNVPSSITITNISITNASSIAADNITKNGFRLKWVATVGGVSEVGATYTTVGN